MSDSSNSGPPASDLTPPNDSSNGNPFPADVHRHHLRTVANRAAILRLHLPRQRALTGPDTPESHLAFIVGRFQIWAERGLSVVLSYQCALDYEKWLESYADSELRLYTKHCPPNFDPDSF